MMERLGTNSQDRDPAFTLTTVWLSVTRRAPFGALVHCCFHWKAMNNNWEAKCPLSNIFWIVFSQASLLGTEQDLILTIFLSTELSYGGI